MDFSPFRQQQKYTLSHRNHSEHKLQQHLDFSNSNIIIQITTANLMYGKCRPEPAKILKKKIMLKTKPNNLQKNSVITESDNIRITANNIGKQPLRIHQIPPLQHPYFINNDDIPATLIDRIKDKHDDLHNN